jgi:formylglycine-generating enzyme required for sulfatase activity
MLFDPGQKEAICAQWQRLEEARQGSHNRAPEEDAAEPALFTALNASFKAALEADTPQCWRSVCDANSNLRAHLRQIDMRETSFFDALVDAGDMIEAALKDAAKEPKNAIAFRELEEVKESIGEAQAQIREERSRTPIWEREKRRRLDEAGGQFEESKRQINVLSGNSLTIHIDADGIVAGIKELVEAVEKGVKLTQDADFTGPLKRAADKVWQTTKRFVRATRQRFAALRLPWPKTAADDNGERGGRGSKDSFKDFDGAPEMVMVPAGCFWMGSRDGEGDKHEWPRHEVIIPRAFAVGRYPVTFEEWDFAQGDKDWRKFTGMEPRKPADQGWGRSLMPVIDVSWEDGQAYVKWLTRKAGKPYRLLSEAEWEYACRAGSEAAYCFGDSSEELGDYAWYDGNSGGRTHPVGEKKPNAFGLYDMHGNVREWCEDYWHDSYKDKPKDLNASAGAWTVGGSNSRVLRGGSWDSLPRNLRAARRVGGGSGLRDIDAGLRVARTF